MNTYNLIVAGGRDYDCYETLKATINDYASMLGDGVRLQIVSGMAKGADTMAVQYANEFDLELLQFPADWNKHGRSAGYIRNAEMAYGSDGLAAFWDTRSRGTSHMINTMRRLKKNVLIVEYQGR